MHRRYQHTALTVVKLGRRDFCFNVFSREQCLVALSHLFVSFGLSLEIRDEKIGRKKVWLSHFKILDVV